MSNDSNAANLARYATFSGLVSSKLWSAIKGRMSDEDFKRYNDKPELVLLALRNGFLENNEIELVQPNSLFFADEEKASTYTYPEKYAVKSVCEQLVELSKYFPNLDSSEVLSCSKEAQALPVGAEGLFVVPKFEKVGKDYNNAVDIVLEMIGSKRAFINYRKGETSSKYLKLSERTAFALNLLGQKQKGDFLLIPSQFGLRHRGRSVRRVREVISNTNEFGHGSFAVSSMLLSHPERLVKWEQLHVDCGGDEYSPDAVDRFDKAPIFDFGGGGVRFDASYAGSASESYGSASGFLS